MRRYQKGDAGAAMLAVMLVVMVGFWLGGMWQGGDRAGHMSGTYGADKAGKTALELLDEAYARGETGREE